MTSKANMIFVRRDEEGRIDQVSLRPQEGFETCMAVSESEQSDYSAKVSGQINSLASSDLMLVRVLEDLIDLLIDKDLICFTDLPQVAQQKLLDRRSIRTDIKGLDLLGEEFDGLL